MIMTAAILLILMIRIVIKNKNKTLMLIIMIPTPGAFDAELAMRRPLAEPTVTDFLV